MSSVAIEEAEEPNVVHAVIGVAIEEAEVAIEKAEREESSTVHAVGGVAGAVEVDAVVAHILDLLKHTFNYLIPRAQPARSLVQPSPAGKSPEKQHLCRLDVR